jgi:predicted amidophosphoribosyltransferase
MEKLGLDIADRMAGLVPEGVENEGVVLCPVPLSPERERERGYNPASILSLRIAKLKNLHHRTLLQKVKSVPPQMSLTKELRLRNPLGAYQLSKPGALPYRILLVDDVFTTGATLEECAKVLKGSGTQWVGALVWGRTPRYF